MWVQIVQVSPALLGCIHRVHWCRCAGSLWLQDLPEVALVLWSCVPLLLSALSLCSWCVVLEYALISRFKGVFRGFCGACVGLCCSGALRGLWGFCTRERLGGLKACCVFAPVFLLLLLCLPPFMLVVLLCSGCLSLSSCIVFVALWVWLLFPFPFRTTRKKKGRKGFALCVLSSCVVSGQILVTLSKNSVAVALAFSSSFG